jgi:transcriptional regulator with XRE-family HTH domain
MKLNNATITSLTQKQGITQNELARNIGVSHGTLSNALNGHKGAGRKLLAGLLRQFPNESVASLTERG